MKISLHNKINLLNYIRTKSDFHAYDFFDKLFLIIIGSFLMFAIFSRKAPPVGRQQYQNNKVKTERIVKDFLNKN